MVRPQGQTKLWKAVIARIMKLYPCVRCWLDRVTCMLYPPLFWLHNRLYNYCGLLNASKSKLLVTIYDHKKDNRSGDGNFL